MYKKLLDYQEEDKKLKALEDGLKSNEDYKKYNVSYRFLKTVNETKTQIEDRAAYLMSVLNNLEKDYARLLEEKVEFDDAPEAEDESTLVFLKKKAQELSKTFADIEREIEKLNKEMSDLVLQYKKLSVDTKNMKEQFEKSKDSVVDMQKQFEQQKGEITIKLTAIAKDIPSELMAKYQAARKTSKFPLVHVIDGADVRHCVACGTEFSALSVAKLKKDKFIECENCRKLIFIK